MSIDVMKQALEALDCIYSPMHVREIKKVGAAMKALRAAIEQAQAPYMTYSNIKVDPVTGDVGIGTTTGAYTGSNRNLIVAAAAGSNCP